MFFRLCLPASVMGKLSSTLNRMGFMRMTSLSIYTWKWLSLPPETATAQSYPPGPLQPRYLSHIDVYKRQGVLCAVCLCAVGGGITEVLISPIVEALPSEDKAGSMSLLHAFYCWGHVGVVVLSTLYFALAGTGRWALLPVLWAVLPLCNMVLFARVPLCKLAGDEHHTPLRALLKSKMIWLFLLMMVCAGASEPVSYTHLPGRL